MKMKKFLIAAAAVAAFTVPASANGFWYPKYEHTQVEHTTNVPYEVCTQGNRDHRTYFTAKGATKYPNHHTIASLAGPTSCETKYNTVTEIEDVVVKKWCHLVVSGKWPHIHVHEHCRTAKD